ncbi:Trehalase [Aphelenchoides fujianensis]|nr:Trehalase [Aphelenchoides fujianensis]
MLYYVVSLLSQIYCDGPILQAVQEAHLYHDSKFYVDMPLRMDPVSTLKDFYELGEKAKDPKVLKQFVDAHFEEPGHELIEVYPKDWVPFPQSFQKIEDVKDDVRTHQERYSLLYLPNNFIIPGGRFREFYYWEVLPMLEKEFNFWMNHRMQSYIDPKTNQTLFHFFQCKAGHTKPSRPAPESYREDMELAAGLKECHRTGADLLERRLGRGDRMGLLHASGSDRHNMKSIRTWSVVPVDLNAFMCINTRVLASFYEIAGDTTKALKYQRHYENMKLAMKVLHWNESDGIWYDYDLENKETLKHVLRFERPSVCFDDEDEVTPYRVYDYLKREGWDKENAWPPMVHMIIEGFRTSGEPKLMQAAELMATQWLIVNYKAYINTYAMFEKYNVSMSDTFGAGGGGEYEVQKGFGWTSEGSSHQHPA